MYSNSDQYRLIKLINFIHLTTHFTVKLAYSGHSTRSDIYFEFCHYTKNVDFH